ncbi:hypothetical protein HYH03_000265 [Edaphochlamys debaryana]|uniref:Expansin-like EG45 domain-containing protein n=1 Tax=Edaphochlamys debaryana TaxID=47281 RepID=A0A835YFA7_9CHLO|nr:hypothetical protein HYH03_000265 [Edaphochlamys debaryana]|eukprot:KAG2501765.1 hypothetical protein HYH03_000265 [Edaphochlamys debaryana]
MASAIACPFSAQPVFLDRKDQDLLQQPCTSSSSLRASPCTSASASASAPAASSSARSLAMALSAVVALSSLPFRAVADDGGWTTGRSTFYGQDGGATIDQGSCMYGPLPNYMVSTGKDIAALSDTASDYAGSCGRCYEVMCNPSAFSDGYGNWIDRNGACKGGSVIVTITDTCPCYYPANEYSNKRWCCGDMQHMDLSQEAFSKIADINQGVIGIKFRQVSCPGDSHPSPRKGSSEFPAGSSR